LGTDSDRAGYVTLLLDRNYKKCGWRINTYLIILQLVG